MRKNTNTGKGIGCIGWIGILMLISLAIIVYSYCWIVAIPALIYSIVSKKFKQYRVRNSIISGVVLITSFIVFITLNAPKSLEALSVDWGNKEFYLGETIDVEVTGSPSDVKIEDLKLSSNEIASLEYVDGKATVTFIKAGDASLFFTANGDITSKNTHIYVIDREEEEKAEAEQKAAEEEAQRQAELQAQWEAEQQAAEEEARRQAELQAQQEAEQRAAAEAQAQQETTQQATSEDPIVYITNTGSKYHRASCRTLKSQIEKHLSEVRGVYAPCGVCNPPQ